MGKIYSGSQLLQNSFCKTVSRDFYIPPVYVHCNYQRAEEEKGKDIFGEMEELAMKKGFLTDDGYMGFVEGRYILFASESDYYEYMND